MADMTRNDGLRTIFSFFLGLMLAAFLGVGVYTFHPPPKQFEASIRDLDHQEKAIRNSKPSHELTDADREQIQEIDRQRNELIDADAAAQEPWGRSTSIILMVFATLTMAISLVRANQLPVISSGLLLGGIFTMIYGVGWIVATDTSITRFLVMSVALLLTLGLGYIRFVQRGRISPIAAGAGVPSGEGIADIERRLSDLEERMEEAAQVFGRNRDSSSSS